MNFVEVIKECESANGAGTKKIIMSALQKADKDTKKLIKEALNPYRVFGIRKFTMPKIFDNNIEGLGTSLESFYYLLDELHSRNLTGNAAKDAVENVLSMFTKEQAEYLSRVFDKDLKAGFSADTFNKVWPESRSRIPTFKVMLADKCESTEDFEKNVSFPALCQAKLDGERTIAIVEGSTVTYYSRSGKEAVHVNGLFDSDLIKIRDYLGYDIVVDGERFAGNFIETVNAKKEGNDAAKNNLRFIVFFLMPLEDWVNESTSITTRECLSHLDKILTSVKCEKIKLPVSKEVSNYAEMMEFCNEMIDVHKEEGLIVKNWDSPYVWERSFAWTKVKRMYDVDCRVVNTYKGRPKSRLEGKMGGLVCVGFLESGERVEVNVGSGFSDEDRERTDWVGQTVVIKYQEVSRSKGKEVASLRFPVYMNTRDDKIVEIE